MNEIQTDRMCFTLAPVTAGLLPPSLILSLHWFKVAPWFLAQLVAFLIDQWVQNRIPGCGYRVRAPIWPSSCPTPPRFASVNSLILTISSPSRSVAQKGGKACHLILWKDCPRFTYSWSPVRFWDRVRRFVYKNTLIIIVVSIGHWIKNNDTLMRINLWRDYTPYNTHSLLVLSLAFFKEGGTPPLTFLCPSL